MAATAGLAPITTPDGDDLSANQQPRIVATSIALIAIPAVLVSLRFMARTLSKAGLWWDDWLILAAFLVSIGPNALAINASYNGFGVHIAADGDFYQRIDVAEWWFKMLYAYETLYTVAITLAKYSILLFYSRIFKERRFQMYLKVVFGIVTAWFIAVEIVVLAECVPVQALWDPMVNGTCINLFVFFQACGAPNVVINAIILVLPLPMIWSLEIDRKHKLALSGVFLLGGFVVVISIIRLVVLSQTQIVDVTWEFVNAAVWTSAEPSIAVSSASLPILRSLWVWNRRRGGSRKGIATPESYDEPKTPVSRPRGGAKGLGGVVKKSGSFSSQQYPLNELPAGAQQMFGNRVVVATGDRTRKVSDDEEMWADLPIMHPQEAAYAAAFGRQVYNRTPETPSQRSELYG